MKNSALYLVGAVLLLGGGAFLFLKNKKPKDLLKLKDLDLEKVNGSTSEKTSTPKTNPLTGLPIAQIKDETKNIEQATNLASKISLLKNKKISYTLMPLKEFSKTEEGFYGRFETNRLMLEKYKSDALESMEKELKDLTIRISKLGYIEVNGSIAKIN